MAVARALVDVIDSELRAAADPSSAPGMRAYMKSAMPYLGVRVPEVRRIVKAAERMHPLDETTARPTIAALWRAAEFREQRYAATDLITAAERRGLTDATWLALYRELIVTGAWWDHVDAVTHHITGLLADHPDVIEPELRVWSRGDDMWLRRSAIISQLGRKDATDVALLADLIEPNLGDREFFIAKAIGWALREYARTDPDWVRTYVAGHAGRLVPLSRREALKHL